MIRLIVFTALLSTLAFGGCASGTSSSGPAATAASATSPATSKVPAFSSALGKVALSWLGTQQPDEVNACVAQKVFSDSRLMTVFSNDDPRPTASDDRILINLVFDCGVPPSAVTEPLAPAYMEGAVTGGTPLTLEQKQCISTQFAAASRDEAIRMFIDVTDPDLTPFFNRVATACGIPDAVVPTTAR